MAKIKLNLPFGIGSVELAGSDVQQRVAWAFYVELATRVATQPVDPVHGGCREALSSIHEIFAATREVLKDQGPDAVKGDCPVGPLAIRVLNTGVRPFIEKWHSNLRRYEDEQRLAWAREHKGTLPAVDESAWPARNEFFQELEAWRRSMLDYVEGLGRVAGVSENDAERFQIGYQQG